MKTRKFISAAICIAALASCQKEAGIESGDMGFDLEPMTLTTGSQTKTTISGSDILWTENDAVKVFDNKGGANTFTASEISGANATFTGSVTAGTTEFFAVYPAENEASVNGNTVTVTIPEDQTSMAGSFAEEHNISIARGAKTPGNADVTGVMFKNVCSWLKFTIPAYIGDAKSVTVSSNSVMAGKLTVDYSAEEPSYAAAEDGATSISMTGTYEAGSTFWFVLAPITLDGITVEVETAKGTYSMSTSAQFEMTAGQYRNLGMLELKKISATSASAEHTYENGVLTGTKVTVNLDIPEETLPYVTDLKLTVSKADGTVVRILSKDSASATETLATDAAWPYLPTGDYIVSGTYTLSGITEKELKTISFNISEKPVFDVQVNDAYTSYTKYSAGNSSAANSLNGSTIYNVGAKVTVADAILNNANYPSLVLTDNGSSVSAGDLSGKSWGSHTIKASYTLDGVSNSSEISCEVTGLPYDYNFVNGSLDQYKNDGWTLNGQLRVGNETLAGRDNTLVLHHRRYSKVIWVLFNEHEKGFVVSPKFHTPKSIDIQPSIIVSSYNAGGDLERTGYIGAVSQTSETNTSLISFTTTGGNSPGGTKYGSGVWHNSFQISATSPYISIDCNDRSDGLLGAYYFLHEAHFRYAE